MSNVKITKGYLHKAVLGAVQGQVQLDEAKGALEASKETLVSVCRTFLKSPKGRDLIADELWDLSDDMSPSAGNPFHKLRLTVGNCGYSVQQVKDEEDGEQVLVNFDITRKGKGKKRGRAGGKAEVQDYQVHDAIVAFGKRYAKKEAWIKHLRNMDADKIKKAIMAGIRAG